MDAIALLHGICLFQIPIGVTLKAQRSVPVVIGNKVWVSHGVSILKGTNVPSRCIVGAKKLASSVRKSEKELVAGIPATSKRTGVEWSR